MTRCPPRSFARGHLLPLLIATLLPLVLGSCGRTLATAPDAASGAHAGTLSAGARNASEYLNEVAVLPAAGTDVHQLATDFGAAIAPGSNYICVRFLPGSGETATQLAERMTGDPRVLAAERNALVETAESRQESYASDDGRGSLEAAVEQPAARVIGLAAAHTVSEGDGVKVAIIDTGVDPLHPLLRSRIVGGVDYVNYDSDPTDVPDGLDNDGDGQVDEAYGHGTHVAGLVAIAAPRAQLLIVRALDADGRGDVATVTAGIRWAINHGARVLNLSLGMLHPSICIETLLQSAQAAGVVVVCSAGNWGSEFPSEYPATSPRVIAVAATDAFRRPADFTSYGTHVAISAPGVAVRSAYPGGGWRLWSGTSMSAPLVSGTAALLLSLHPGWGREQVAARIGQTARRINGETRDQDGKLGAGMLQAGQALAAETPRSRPGPRHDPMRRPR